MTTSIPFMIYGTAWKKGATADLVERALLKGFRGVDTACQPRHYHEPGVGEGLLRAKKNGIDREAIFLQTKFTPADGQDPESIPYDPNASFRDQVLQSFEVSKKNLHTEYLDCLVLHSPLRTRESLFQVWDAMSEIYEFGGTKMLGISNCYDLAVLKDLVANAGVKPSVIQNRLYAETAYDFDLRKYCREFGIVYESFWTLTANPQILSHSNILEIADQKSITPAQVFFSFLSKNGIVPLTGTKSDKHMEEDLNIPNIALSDQECSVINSLGPFV